MFFGLRFDFRNPDLAATTTADRYAAALDMAAWADRLGCVNIAVSEHHGSADGYLPSPIPMLAAMAARTSNVRFMIAALIAPFHDPLRLAEDLIVLDNLSRGRVDADPGRRLRPRRVRHVRRAPRGAGPARHRDDDHPAGRLHRRALRVPGPHRAGHAGALRPGGPSLLLGGSSEPAARRAARIADGFIPSVPEVWEFYRDEVQVLGRDDPGPCPIGDTQVVALATDPDRGWEQMAPYFFHETDAYGAWQAQADIESPYHSVADLDALAATGQYRVLTPEQFIDEQKGQPFPFAMFHPLCGGMPIDLAWSSLHLFENEVLPAFSSP